MQLIGKTSSTARMALRLPSAQLSQKVQWFWLAVMEAGASGPKHAEGQDVVLGNESFPVLVVCIS